MYMSPINNRLLANLSEVELQPLRPRLSAVELQAGSELHVAGAVLANVYFPVSATVSLTTALRDGSSLEVAAVGNEGMVGVSTFLGGGPALGSAIVQSAGMALRLPATALRLQQAGLIRYTRGRMELRDRAGLEARCCECYEAVRDTTLQPPVSQPSFAPMQRYGT